MWMDMISFHEKTETANSLPEILILLNTPILNNYFSMIYQKNSRYISLMINNAVIYEQNLNADRLSVNFILPVLF